ARDGDYSCSCFPLSEPMRSEPSGVGGLAASRSPPDDPGTIAAGDASAVRLSRNVADGTKNRLPVTTRLKSSSRAYLPGGLPTNRFSSSCAIVPGDRL